MMQLIRSVVVVLLTWEARLVLWRHKPTIVAVTGSVGKTSAKDAIHAVLHSRIVVGKTKKTMNSEFGVPLSVLGLDTGWNRPLRWALILLQGAFRALFGREYPAWLVLEVGADKPGDIRAIARWLRPHIAVITGVPEVPTHVEFFSSPEDVFREKRILAEYLRPGGKLILNGDDLRMREMHSEYRGASILYGLEPGSAIIASHVETVYENEMPVGMRFRVECGGSSVPVEVFGALGLPRVYAALASLAVGQVAGIDLVTGARALREWEPTAGRLRILKGLKGSLIIDDSYNSSPAAAFAALDVLKEVKGRRRIAILGDMLELGKYAREEHRKVGEKAAECADMLATVGFRSRATAEAALDAGMKESRVRQYELHESARAGKELETILRAGDIVLVKGSQGMRMERTVKEIMAEPERAQELLVRQDPEWLER